MAVGRSRREKTSSCKSWRPSMRLQTHRRLRADAFGSTTEVSSCGITNYRWRFRFAFYGFDLLDRGREFLPSLGEESS